MGENMNVTTIVIWILTVNNPSLYKGTGFDSAYATSDRCEAARSHAQGIENFGPHKVKTQYSCTPVAWKGAGS
jgi:hypothetical protein